MESASAVSDAPSDASPSVLRASKKLCWRGCLSLMKAAGGAGSALVGASSVLIGSRLAPGRTLDRAGAGAGSEGERSAMVAAPGEIVTLLAAALGASGGAVEAARSDFDGAGAGESSVVAEASVGEAERDPRSSVANADGPKNANSMAHAMASLTQSPCT